MAKLQISRSDYECIEHPPAPYKDGTQKFVPEWILNQDEKVYETEAGVLRVRVLDDGNVMILIHRQTIKVVAGLKLPMKEARELADTITQMIGKE